MGETDHGVSFASGISNPQRLHRSDERGKRKHLPFTSTPLKNIHFQPAVALGFEIIPF